MVSSFCGKDGNRLKLEKIGQKWDKDLKSRLFTNFKVLFPAVSIVSCYLDMVHIKISNYGDKGELAFMV